MNSLIFLLKDSQKFHNLVKIWHIMHTKKIKKGAKMLNTTKTLKDDMLVGDLVDNHEFDINCNFEIYDCTKRGTDWNDGGKKIFSTIDDGCVIPGDKILEMRVQYMTLDLSRQAIVIEAGKVD